MVTEKIYDSGEAAVLGTVTDEAIEDSNGFRVAGDMNKYLNEQGKLYMVSSGNIQGSTAAGNRDCLFVVTSGYQGRFKFNVEGSADMLISLHEAVGVTGSGTLLTWANTNRITKGSPHCSFYSIATLSSTGSPLFHKYVTDAVGKFCIDNIAIPAGTVYALRINPMAIGTFSVEAILQETTV